MESVDVTTTDIYQSTTVERLQRLLTRIVTKAPMLQERAESAVVILTTGRIALVAPSTFQAQGAGEQPYELSTATFTCSCPDWQHRAPEFASRRWCKHLIAAAMLEMLTAAEESPRPAQGPGRQARLRTCRCIHAARRPARRAA
jgi:hypothetical protein